jgi:hypothetical protein
MEKRGSRPAPHATLETMNQIRDLLWLRLRHTFGFHRKRVTAIVTAAVSIAAGLSFALGAYFGGLVALWGLPAETSRQLLNGGLSLLYVGWLISPLVGISMNQSFDVSKLLLFPVSPRRIFAANILGSLLDPFTLTFLIALAAIPVGLANGVASGLMMALLVLVFVFHTISFSQALLTLLWGLMKSRRIRDLWKVVAAVFGMVFWAVYNIGSRRMSADTVAYALNARPAQFTRFLPSGWTADAAFALSRGDTIAFLWRFALLVAICAATVALAGSLLARIYTGDIEIAALAPRDKPVSPPDQGRASGRLRRANVFDFLPAPAAAMARKEWMTFGRDPVVKIEILRGIFFALVMPFIVVLSGSNSGVSQMTAEYGGPAIIGYVFLTAFVATTSISLNLLAREREGFTLLVTLPTPRVWYLLGKNTAALALLAPTLLVVALASCAWTGRWDLLPGTFVCAVAASLMTMGATNVGSVWFPMPLAQKGQNPLTQPRGAGCLPSLLGLLALPVMLALAAPIPAAVLIPAITGHQTWMWLTVPASVLYACFLYVALTLMAGASFMRREPEIVATLLRLPA